MLFISCIFSEIIFTKGTNGYLKDLWWNSFFCTASKFGEKDNILLKYFDVYVGYSLDKCLDKVLVAQIPQVIKQNISKFYDMYVTIRSKSKKRICENNSIRLSNENTFKNI